MPGSVGRMTVPVPIPTMDDRLFAAGVVAVPYP
jgi:hypothetical protein